MRLLIGWAMLLGVAVGAAEPASPVTPLRAGAAAVDITPQQYPLSMPGLFTARQAESAHDPLHARALVLSNGATTVALVVVDNISVSPATVEEAKVLASQQTGLAVDRILLASTHTHTGPPSHVKTGPAPEVAYRKLLVAGIAEAVARAHAALRPAAVGAAAGSLPDEVHNRRWFLKPGKMPRNPFGGYDQVKMNPERNPAVLDRPAGPTDPELLVLSVADAASGRPLALLANFALHYVGNVPEGQLSADYFGEFARVAATHEGLEPGFVAMMFNGAQGDVINRSFVPPPPTREPFEQVRIVGAKTAATAWSAQATIAAHRPNARLAMVERRVTLQTRRPTPEQIAAAEAVLATKDEAARAKLPALAVDYAKRVLALVKSPATVTVTLQALLVGDLAMCAIPFEPFCEIGLELKRRSGFPHTMVLGIANGSNGYLPTPAQHQLGGYETWLGTNRVQPDASDIITRHLLEMLGELAHQNMAP